MKLVDNASQVWKHFSTRALAVVAMLQVLASLPPQMLLDMWAVLPPALKTALGPDVAFWVSLLTALVAIWGIGGKYVKQRLEPAGDPQTGNEPQGLS